MSPALPQPPDAERVRAAMELALEQARLAVLRDEVPVGAVVLGPDELLAAAHNEIETLRDPTAHAERLALTRACSAVGAPRLPEGCLLAATLEPCAMCAGAIVLARVRFLVFGAPDPKAGACGSLRDVVRDVRLNHRVELLAPVLGSECGSLLTGFFQARRSGRSRDCPERG